MPEITVTLRVSGSLSPPLVAVVSTLPRQGEAIIIEDGDGRGHACRVTDVQFDLAVRQPLLRETGIVIHVVPEGHHA